jgi:AraC-like DNA-binding protein
MSSTGIDAIAGQLGMKSKILERRLAEQGKSFGALLDRTRFNAVTHYLQDPDMSLAQVAYPAGFTEPAFVRASSAGQGKRHQNSAYGRVTRSESSAPHTRSA